MQRLMVKVIILGPSIYLHLLLYFIQMKSTNIHLHYYTMTQGRCLMKKSLLNLNLFSNYQANNISDDIGHCCDILILHRIISASLY